MKAITFLGAGKAFETAYVFEDGQEYTAPYFGVALSQHYPDLEMRVLVTPEAKEKHWQRFQEMVGDAAELEAIDIQGGHTEEELWDIFETVIEVVEKGEQVIFDITHGFRSLPFLSFLAAAYLRVVEEIELVAVLYGNFEARDQSVTPNRAPVIDLTPFVGLLDWMVAADRFVRFGDAHDLAERLRASKPDYRQQQHDPGQRRIAKTLSDTAKALDSVSSALRLIRPNDAIIASDKLQTDLTDATQGIQSFARPFQPLSRRVISEYAPLAANQEIYSSDLTVALDRERRLVYWYLDRRQYVQAMAVAREWIVTWALAHLGYSDQFDKEARGQIERAMGAQIQKRSGKAGYDSRPDPTIKVDLTDVPQLKTAIDLYSALGNTRNDLLHAGKRRAPQPANRMEKQIIKLCNRLDELPLLGDLGNK